jgi:hypothetical protein
LAQDVVDAVTEFESARPTGIQPLLLFADVAATTSGLEAQELTAQEVRDYAESLSGVTYPVAGISEAAVIPFYDHRESGLSWRHFLVDPDWYVWGVLGGTLNLVDRIGEAVDAWEAAAGAPPPLQYACGDGPWRHLEESEPNGEFVDDEFQGAQQVVGSDDAFGALEIVGTVSESSNDGNQLTGDFDAFEIEADCLDGSSFRLSPNGGDAWVILRLYDPDSGDVIDSTGSEYFAPVTAYVDQPVERVRVLVTGQEGTPFNYVLRVLPDTF